MWLDGIAILIVLFFAALGYFQGIIVQMFRIIGLVLVFFYIYLVAEPMGQWVSAHLDLNPVVAYYVALIGGALILYAACSLMGKAIHKMLAKTEKPQTLDRVMGMAVGLIKGAIIAFLLLCMIDMIPPARTGSWTWLREQAAGSSLVVRLHPWNPLPELRFLADVDDYKKLFDDPEAQRIFQAQPAFVRLQDNPKVRDAFSDPGLRMLVAQKKWAEVLRNEKVLALVFDRDVRKLANDLRPKAALDEAARLRNEKPQ